MDELRALALLGRLRVPAGNWMAAQARPGGRREALGLLLERAPPPSPELLEADLDWIERSGTRLVDCASPAYPARLAATPGAPALLYVQGALAALRSPQVAIVGSRGPTAGGHAIAREFAAALGAAGLTITSGLAAGIDAASHAGALAAGASTIAVFGTGLDAVYPAAHAALAAAIRGAGGALVSELPPRSPPRRTGFPRRNRLISGLALAVLVVEAAEASGSIRTAEHARSQGRPVFAIPGSIRNPLARGCHALIRGGARLVSDPRELLYDLDFSQSKQSLDLFEARPHAAPELDKEREILLDACGFDPISLDVLVERTGLPPESVASLLFLLELDGLVEPHPGGRYGRVQQASR